MLELERKALLGDKLAQHECMEKGIVLPCPFCGEEMKNDPPSQIYYHSGYNCILSRFSFSIKDKAAFLKWNTRQIPPIGECKECSYSRKTKEENIVFCNGHKSERLSNDYCMCFDFKK